MDLKRHLISFVEVTKAVFFESPFFSFGELLINWIWQWKWTCIVTVTTCSVLLVVINIILVGVIPIAAGEYRFRGILGDPEGYRWKVFSARDCNKWKNYISAYRADKSHDKLGNYEIASVTVFRHSLKNKKNTAPMGPLDNHLVIFLCQKKDKPNVYLTFEKIFGVPELSLLKLYFGRAKKGGIYVQLSRNRDDALSVMNGKFEREHLDVGTRRWGRKKGSRVTVQRMLQYYTQKSLHLSASYHIYSSNSFHFVNAIVDMLDQMQEEDLDSNVKSISDGDFSLFYAVYEIIVRFVVQLL